MTSRERLLAVLHGEVPDCVPCAPDISNMVPCRLTGKKFWDIYLYQDPPLWKAYLDAAKFFDIDAGIECYTITIDFDADPAAVLRWEERIVHRMPDGAPVTQMFDTQSGHWQPLICVYWADNPPSRVKPEKIGLPAVPATWEPVTGVKEWPRGIELWKLAREMIGDQGVLGLASGASTLHLHNEDDVLRYYDDPEPYRQRSRDMVARLERRFEQIAAMDPRPDFLFCGASGSLIWQTPTIFRELGLPPLQRATELASELGIPTHVHSCGPEQELVEIAATETRLTVIDPLEIPPMGNCVLADLKARFGDQIVLKGNLHTTEVMLRGSVDEVVAASRQAIDDGAAGGGFILSTGDQCGRDTPDANLRAMVETARTYGRY
ncbi:MAG: hypothetical protein IT204_03025 [Fimbriimonadaceae bacterium]|nr:hypothetical protein [Fimbriimonadaceae bacterium]